MPEKGPFNVILISFDTLRRDHLHVYGHPKELSPNLDKLAGDGVLFSEAVVNCGWTLPQHMTLLTGLYPIKHGLIYLSQPCKLSENFRTLAEVFQENGYLTFGFGNQNGYGGGWQYGFYRGMRSYSNIFPYNNMMEKVVEPVAWSMEMAGETPFYIYIHTNDTHEPFAASEPFGLQWGNEYQNRYEGEVTYVDHYFGLILDKLQELGLEEKTLIVATSDHGSEFHEHGFLEKKLNLYEEISQIPLIMKLPYVIPAGKKVFGLCQTSDIAPTILDICSLPIPEEVDGQSLLNRIIGKEENPPEIVFAHTLHETTYWYEHFSARSADYKFISTVPLKPNPQEIKGAASERFKRLASIAQLKNGIWRELYNLKDDPQEEQNIIDGNPDVERQLAEKLDQWLTSCDYTPRESKLSVDE
jgi:arylsulfatase A-like enzyme